MRKSEQNMTGRCQEYSITACLLQDKRGKLLKNHTRDIRRDIVGGGGQPEAGLIGRWMSKNSKQNATAGEKVAAKLARLSPKSLLTMLKKNAGLKPLPIAAAGEVNLQQSFALMS